ncbi:MAG TPA: hypothetical protein VLH10_00245 [Yinghuangia sp.]|uniref:hypothetical protein n=1 Tax=Yinghuangia sp. YIM S10712 TaxID=3436930 RepID=UPI002C1C21CE|nr:hypothetical protein [Yinghuangia sp.]
MSTGAVIGIIVAVLGVLLILAAVMWMHGRRRELRERFGPEYDRTVRAEGSRRAAERELRARRKRHDSLDIQPLPPAAREQYAQEWSAVQEHFVDTPDDAVAEADVLVTRLMNDRGYPTEGYEQRIKDLSVEHGRTLEHYRDAHEVHKRATAHEATTEELRGAMVHYRAVFNELLTAGRRS